MKGKCLQVLTALGDAGLAITGYNNVVDEAREWGNTADEKRHSGAPIRGVSR